MSALKQEHINYITKLHSNSFGFITKATMDLNVYLQLYTLNFFLHLYYRVRSTCIALTYSLLGLKIPALAGA